jgi:DNA-binding MarR family transcriptional regulator
MLIQRCLNGFFNHELRQFGVMIQRRLGELIQIEKSLMVLFLEGQEADGWALKKSDPQDRQAHVVRLMREGTRKFARLGPRLLAAQSRFLEPHTDKEIAILTETLKRLVGGHEIDGDNQVASVSDSTPQAC